MKKRQLSVRWPVQLYMLAKRVGKEKKLSTGWILSDWAEKGAKVDGYTVPAENQEQKAIE